MGSASGTPSRVLGESGGCREREQGHDLQSDAADGVTAEGVIERSGSPALDLGCATGRLLLDYVRDGVDIDGVDASAQMLDLVRAKARRADAAEPALHQQHLEELSLPRRYATILAASSALSS